jgi:pimeloyl-ACP methyl ester carboxylesterase
MMSAPSIVARHHVGPWPQGGRAEAASESLVDVSLSAGAHRCHDVVVLTHGFMAHRLLLTRLSGRLRRAGWRTHIWGYESLRTSVARHAERFADLLSELSSDEQIDRIHLVTHSMGCIIGRLAINLRPQPKLGRFVMLTPPNQGSFVATQTVGIFGRLFPPVAELTTNPDSLVNTLADPDGVEVGVIAAAHDALVEIESTRLRIPHEHITLPCLHSAVLFRKDTAEFVNSFLTTGRFVSGDSR